MRTLLFTILFLILNLTINAQCIIQQSINDDFESYAAGSGAALPSCWASAGSSGLIIGNRNSAGESYSGTKYISIYTFFTANATSYIISPELSTIDGNHFAQFYVNVNNTDVTLEYGTMSNQTTTSTFSVIGTASLTPNAYTQVNSGLIPTNSGHNYFALKFTAPTMHSSIKIDDFSWTTLTTGINKYYLQNAIRLYPNPASGNEVKLISETDFSNYDMTIYNIVGQNVLKEKASKTINVSGWEKGLYTIQLQNHNSSKTLKLIVE